MSKKTIIKVMYLGIIMMCFAFIMSMYRPTQVDAASWFFAIFSATLFLAGYIGINLNKDTN